MMGEPYFLYGADEHRRSVASYVMEVHRAITIENLGPFTTPPWPLWKKTGTKRTGTFDVPEGHKQRPHLGCFVCAEGEGKLEETQGKVGIVPEGRTGRLWL